MGLRTGNVQVVKDEAQREADRKATENIIKKNTIKGGMIEERDLVHTQAAPVDESKPRSHLSFMEKLKTNGEDINQKFKDRMAHHGPGDAVPGEPSINALPTAVKVAPNLATMSRQAAAPKEEDKLVIGLNKGAGLKKIGKLGGLPI